MSLEIGSAISDGFDRFATTAGLYLAGAAIVLSLLSTVGVNSLVVALDTAGAMQGQQPTLTLPIGVAGGATVFFVGMVLSFVLSLVVLRTMHHSSGELGSIPDGVFDELPLPALFLFVANIVVGIVVAIGFVLLVVPGIFLAVSLVFTQVFVAVEGEGPFEAMGSSWELAKGNRLSLFLLGLVLVVLGFLVGMVGAIAGFVSPALGSIVSALISGFTTVFGPAVLVVAYEQLSEPAETDTDADGGLDDADEWNDPDSLDGSL